MAELQGAKTKNSNNVNKKDGRRSLFIVFDTVALISSVQYKKQHQLSPLTQIKKSVTKTDLTHFLKVVVQPPLMLCASFSKVFAIMDPTAVTFIILPTLL